MKKIIFVSVLAIMLFPFNISKAVTTTVQPTTARWPDYCRVTGLLDGIRKDSNTGVFIMFYKIQKVEQLTPIIPGYDCHGFVVGSTAGLGLDSQFSGSDFAINVRQNFVVDFDQNDKFVRFLSQQETLSCLDFARDLFLTNSNSDVVRLQQFLKDEGHLSAQATGYFGSLTRSALIAFQRDYNLSVSGRLDAVTRAKIKSLTCSGGVVKAKEGEVCNPPVLECESNLYCRAYIVYPNEGARPLSAGKGTCQKADVTMKPVIYLYPETKQQISVKLSYNGILDASLPAYDQNINGWKVTAYPDGKIINSDGREYSYLFWEGRDDVKYDLSSGFVVKGSDTREFLRDTLIKMGLTAKEYNEFIVFWYPKMQGNKYNLIHFATKEYTDNASLEITPKPDSIQRVFMVWKGLDNPISVNQQEIKSFTRKGFSVVEWGGEEIK